MSQLVSKVSTERFWLALSLGMLAASTAIPDEERIGLAVKLFLFVTGMVNGGLILFEWINALSHKREWQRTELSAFRLSQGLPLLPYERKNIEPEKPEDSEADKDNKDARDVASNEVAQPVQVFTAARTSPTFVAVTIKHYPDPPTRKFLQVLFETARSSDGRIRSETGFAELGKEHAWTGSQSNTWLTYTDEQLITEKIYKSATGNSPRRLIAGMTLKLALAKFGIKDEDSQSSDAQNQA